MYQYQKLWAQGDQERAKAFLANHSELKNAMWDPEKYNWLKDAIVALQHFIINDLGTFIADTQTDKAGLQTERSDFSRYRVKPELFPTDPSDSNIRSYSSGVVDAILADMVQKIKVDCPDEWQYDENKQLWTITVIDRAFVKEKDYEKYFYLEGGETAEEIDAYAEKMSLILSGVTDDGSITLYALENPGALSFYVREV